MRFAALWAARATKKPSRVTPFVGFFSATFLRLLERFAFLYRNRKNVAYSRNVMRYKICKALLVVEWQVFNFEY
jgi:hypothetical protein